MSAVMTSNLPGTGITVPRSALGPQGWTALMAAVISVMVLAPIHVRHVSLIARGRRVGH